MWREETLSSFRCIFKIIESVFNVNGVKSTKQFPRYHLPFNVNGVKLTDRKLLSNFI